MTNFWDPDWCSDPIVRKFKGNIGKCYIGRRREDGTVSVYVNVPDGTMYPLDLERSLRVASHSPSGFEWGYAGSGPHQLALAILLDVLDGAEWELSLIHI